MNKLRFGFFKFTSCSGCQLSLLRLNEKLLDLLSLIELRYWVMVTDLRSEGPLDVAFVEGSISTPDEVNEIKEIRRRTGILVAFGDCASTGCVNSIRSWMTQREVEKSVYENTTSIRSIPVQPLDYYVDVDVHLGGCPPSPSNIVEAVKALLLDLKPSLPLYPVCVECKLDENECLLVKGEACMGPVIKAGCGALCPSLNRVCEGCYGPTVDPNPASLADKFREIGLSEDEVICKFRKYAGLTREFREEARL